MDMDDDYENEFLKIEEDGDDGLLLAEIVDGNCSENATVNSEQFFIDNMEDKLDAQYYEGIKFEGEGEGEGTFQAKLDADRKAYHFLCQEEIKRNFSNLDYENPASTLHELFQKKIIMEVRYEFSEYHDENGNPIWNCKAFLEGYGDFFADNVSKKQAKQDVSLKVLHFITDTVIEKSDK